MNIEIAQVFVWFVIVLIDDLNIEKVENDDICFVMFIVVQNVDDEIDDVRVNALDLDEFVVIEVDDILEFIVDEKVEYDICVEVEVEVERDVVVEQIDALEVDLIDEIDEVDDFVII